MFKSQEIFRTISFKVKANEYNKPQPRNRCMYMHETNVYDYVINVFIWCRQSLCRSCQKQKANFQANFNFDLIIVLVCSCNNYLI